jgi:hypothetical protein
VLVAGVAVASPELKLVTVSDLAIREVDALVSADPLEGIVLLGSPFLVGATRAGPDLKFCSICVYTTSNVEALYSQCRRNRNEI